MSVCAVMLVKDEADIIEHTLLHLLGQVDHIVVADNMSTDGTAKIVLGLATKYPGLIHYQVDEELGYYQSRKTSALAAEAGAAGFQWVLPCDADEFWYAPDGRPIRDYLDGIGPDVQLVKAQLFNHIPTALDDSAEANPFKRIVWRLREHAPLPKVCARTHPDLVIEPGNHGAWLPGAMLTIYGLVCRHYTWRSDSQYVTKIVNGAAAYAATDLPEGTGTHWRMYGNPPNPDAVRDHFRQWFYVEKPYENASLILDPAPGA